VVTSTNTLAETKPHIFSPQSVAMLTFFQVPPPTAQPDFMAEGLLPTEKDNHAIYGKNITDIYAFI